MKMPPVLCPFCVCQEIKCLVHFHLGPVFLFSGLCLKGAMSSPLLIFMSSYAYCSEPGFHFGAFLFFLHESRKKCIRYFEIPPPLLKSNLFLRDFSVFHISLLAIVIYVNIQVLKREREQKGLGEEEEGEVLYKGAKWFDIF